MTNLESAATGRPAAPRHRWAILGCGEIAQRGMAPAIAMAGNTELAAVCGRDADKARAFARQHGAARAHDSLDALLADPDVDSIYVATPNHLHARQVIAAARAGKHVLCEKPMGLSLEDCDAMIEACQRHGVRLGVMFQNRYHPAHVEVRRRVMAGEVGRIDFAHAMLCRGLAPSRSFDGWRNDPLAAGSGAIGAQAVHPVDLLRHLMDSEVVRVHAMEGRSQPDAPVEDMIHALLEFDNGARATMVAGWLVPRFDNDVLIYGERMKLACLATLGVPRPGRPCELVVEDHAGITRAAQPDATTPAKMALLLEAFNRAVEEGRDPPEDGINGMQMVRVALALQRSAAEGRAVRV